MKTFKQYFEYEKNNFQPSEKDFLAVLNRIEVKQKSAPEFVPARTHILQRVTFAFSVFAVFVIFINVKEVPQKISERQSISEAVMTIDEINSFNE